MLNLERAIQDWRTQLSRCSIVRPEQLDEMEAHLRDEIKALLEANNLTPEEAFLVAEHRFGSAQELKREYWKAFPLLHSGLLFSSLIAVLYFAWALKVMFFWEESPYWYHPSSLLAGLSDWISSVKFFADDFMGTRSIILTAGVAWIAFAISVIMTWFSWNSWREAHVPRTQTGRTYVRLKF
jgi:hypothetical protein